MEQPDEKYLWCHDCTEVEPFSGRAEALAWAERHRRITGHVIVGLPYYPPLGVEQD